MVKIVGCCTDGNEAQQYAVKLLFSQTTVHTLEACRPKMPMTSPHALQHSTMSFRLYGEVTVCF